MINSRAGSPVSRAILAPSGGTVEALDWFMIGALEVLSSSSSSSLQVSFETLRTLQIYESSKPPTATSWAKALCTTQK